MAREIFVDTSIWVALVDRRDAQHAAINAFYPEVLRQGPILVTTNLVIAETYTLLRYRVGHAAGMGFLEIMRSTAQLDKIYSDAVLETAAAQILQQYGDQDFSFTDAVSFALMRRRNITQAFAFDHHFLTAGFILVPAAPT